MGRFILKVLGLQISLKMSAALLLSFFDQVRKSSGW
jgi:hypothetical protein